VWLALAAAELQLRACSMRACLSSASLTCVSNEGCLQGLADGSSLGCCVLTPCCTPWGHVILEHAWCCQEALCHGHGVGCSIPVPPRHGMLQPQIITSHQHGRACWLSLHRHACVGLLCGMRASSFRISGVSMEGCSLNMGSFTRSDAWLLRVLF